MLVTLKNLAGKDVGQVELNDSIFAADVNTALMHQALMRQLANARLGTHKVKTRGEVRGGGRKPWKQKGTGRARQGSTRAPNWVGGGTVFGPTPRRYTLSLNKKMQRAALRSALSAKAGSEQIVVLDKLALDAPKTRAMADAFKALGINGGSVLLVLPVEGEDVTNVRLSTNNLPKVKMVPSNYLNVRDLLGHDTVVLSSASLPTIEAWLAVEPAGEEAGLAEEEA
jgi:large subunit ribosomal protein L4